MCLPRLPSSKAIDMGEADELKGAVNEGWNFAWRCRGRFAIVQIASNQAAILQLDAPHQSFDCSVSYKRREYVEAELSDLEIT